MIAETNTRIDWWVITRDTLFFIIYLIIITIFLSSNEITLTNALILIVIYFVHIMFMKWNMLYEVAIKKGVARMMEIKELTRIAETDIDFFHKNLNSRAISIEILMKLDYKVEDKYIVFDQQYRKRIKDPKVIIGQEDSPMQMMEDRTYVAKLLWKKSTIKIIIRLQAHKFYEKVRRNRKSVVEITKMLPYLIDDKDNSAREGDESMRYLEGETVLYPRNDDNFIRTHQKTRVGMGGSILKGKMGNSKLDVVSEKSEMGKSENKKSLGDGNEEEEEDGDANSSRISNYSGTVPASSIYEIINKAVNKEKMNLAWPKGFKKRVQYIFLIPLTHMQFMTIPYPGKGSESYYPLTLTLAITWIWFYTYLVCWFTYSVTKAFDLHFSIIPMFLYPFGISFRDIKKYSDFKEAIRQFREDIPDQEVSLAEGFQGQIFQITGLLGLAWLLYGAAVGGTISFLNAGIKYQMPMLLGVVAIKYISLAANRFKSKRGFFYWNISVYIVFIIIAFILDYKVEFFGGD